MPWLAIPFDNEFKRDECNEKYEISGLPTLVLLDGETGKVITNSGRSLVDEYGADAFPFDEMGVEVCKKENKEKKDKALAEMEFLSFMNPLVKIDKSESDEKVDTLINSCEALAVAFLFDDHDPGSSAVISKLVKVQKELGRDKLGLVVVPIQDVDDIKENDYTNQQDCQDFASKGYSCVAKDSCILLNIRGDSNFFTEDAENALCPEDGMVCCHVDNS